MVSITLIVICSIVSPVITLTKGSCDRGSIADRKYLLFNVNPGEGFNLRRDVYIRMACLTKHLQQFGDWTLVVGPISTPHWKSNEAVEWKHFFDINSLSKYVPVIEINDLILLSSDKRKPEINNENSDGLVIDHLYFLQNFKDSWKSGKWEEKFEIAPCEEEYDRKSNIRLKERFWNFNNIVVHNISCISFQGRSKIIVPLLLNPAPMSRHSKIFMIDRAEVLLHDEYGGLEYWKVRRSMRFATHLYELAGEAFRILNLNPAVNVLPDDWRDERKTTSLSKGGDYICGHLRRQDFLTGRKNEVPSLLSAAKKLKMLASSLNTSLIFIASDGTNQEMKELKQHLEPNYQLSLYRPNHDIRKRIREGGIAIVEQIICSRAKYFIGTYESTFSFRIQEEREILNFPPDTTFNRFCAKEEACEQPAKWRIIF